jgi:hypothetical protein
MWATVAALGIGTTAAAAASSSFAKAEGKAKPARPHVQHGKPFKHAEWSKMSASKAAEKKSVAKGQVKKAAKAPSKGHVKKDLKSVAPGHAKKDLASKPQQAKKAEGRLAKRHA